MKTRICAIWMTIVVLFLPNLMLAQNRIYTLRRARIDFILSRSVPRALEITTPAMNALTEGCACGVDFATDQRGFGAIREKLPALAALVEQNFKKEFGMDIQAFQTRMNLFAYGDLPTTTASRSTRSVSGSHVQNASQPFAGALVGFLGAVITVVTVAAFMDQSLEGSIRDVLIKAGQDPTQALINANLISAAMTKAGAQSFDAGIHDGLPFYVRMVVWKPIPLAESLADLWNSLERDYENGDPSMPYIPSGRMLLLQFRPANPNRPGGGAPIVNPNQGSPHEGATRTNDPGPSDPATTVTVFCTYFDLDNSTIITVPC